MAEAMMRSGYPEQYRREVLEDSIVGYQRQVTASEKGETPLYRGREWNKQERTKKKKMKKASWFRLHDVVLFVPATPQEELADRVRTAVKEEWETGLQSESGRKRGDNHGTAPREDGYGQVDPMHHGRLPPLYNKSWGGGRSKASKIRGFVLWNLPPMCRGT